ncbi:hypothetical protein HXX76_001900 [Chlamydomonas incerta]|uniref:Uncharacterized protein n=1 Tax=Chlamydomonas incerta TaxID=51695 RepID=A0A835WA14_CHLIN|nr:hypothetical protein HXX76_001900 [Chlamydomonas incerta]|eukprot:KAG2443548.1 hypothetical protein HXX76_001900 [Chlamydomonas incerta]
MLGANVVLQVQVNGQLVDVLAPSQEVPSEAEDVTSVGGSAADPHAALTQLSTRSVGAPPPPPVPAPGALVQLSEAAASGGSSDSGGGSGGDISYSTMGLIIGLVVGTLFVAFLAVLGYIMYDIARDRKRQHQSMMGLGRASGGGSSTASGAGGRTARLIRPEDDEADAGGGAGGGAAGGKANASTGLPGGHEWTSIHQGVVGMELEDDPPAGSGTPRAGGAGGSTQHAHSQRGGATPPALQLDMNDAAALGNSPGASAAAPTPSRLSGMHAAWGNLLKSSLRGSWDWRQQVSAPLDPLVCSGNESVAATPAGGAAATPGGFGSPRRPGSAKRPAGGRGPSVPSTPAGGAAAVVVEMAERSATSRHSKQAQLAAALEAAAGTATAVAAAAVEQPVPAPPVEVAAAAALTAGASEGGASEGSSSSGLGAVSHGDGDGCCVVGLSLPMPPAAGLTNAAALRPSRGAPSGVRKGPSAGSAGQRAKGAVAVSSAGAGAGAGPQPVVVAAAAATLGSMGGAPMAAAH